MVCTCDNNGTLMSESRWQQDDEHQIMRNNTRDGLHGQRHMADHLWVWVQMDELFNEMIAYRRHSVHSNTTSLHPHPYPSHHPTTPAQVINMPSLPMTGVFLVLSADDLAPWRWPAWQSHTGVMLPPWAPKAEVDAAGGKVKYFAVHDLEAARTFYKNFLAQVGNDRVSYLRKKSDNDMQGRNAITEWINQLLKRVNVADKVTAILSEKNRHPQHIMKQLRYGPSQVSGFALGNHGHR